MRYKLILGLILCAFAAEGPVFCEENSPVAVERDKLYRTYTSNQWALTQVQKKFSNLRSESFEKESLPATIKLMEKLKAKSEFLIRDNERIVSRLKQLGDTNATELTKTPSPEPAGPSTTQLSPDESKTEPEIELLAPVRTELVGSDWLAMSRQEKEQYITLMMEVFEDQGALFLKTPEEHLASLERTFISDTTLLDKPLNNVFVLEVFENEKECRTTIKQIYASLAD